MFWLRRMQNPVAHSYVLLFYLPSQNGSYADFTITCLTYIITPMKEVTIIFTPHLAQAMNLGRTECKSMVTNGRVFCIEPGSRHTSDGCRALLELRDGFTFTGCPLRNGSDNYAAFVPRVRDNLGIEVLEGKREKNTNP